MQVAIFGCGNIGFETVKLLHKDDFIKKIFIFSRSYPQYLKESLENNSLDSNKIVFFQVDAEDENLVETAFSSIIKEKIDVLICTTGVYSTIPATKDFNQFKFDFNLNIFSNFIPIKVALNKKLFNANARIMVISSTAGHYASKSLASYHPSKWGLENLCSTLRAELKSQTVQVDIICPMYMRNKYSKTFNSSHGTEPSVVAGVIENTLNKANTNNKLPGKNYFIPSGQYRAHLKERVFPGILDRRDGLMSKSRRKKNSRKIKLNSGLITGAASGLGKELAILYSKRLKHMYLLDKNQENLEKVKADIESTSDCSVSIICLDLNKLEETGLLADGLTSVDLLINCAGIYFKGPVYHAGMDIWHKMLNINFHSSVLLTSKFLNKPSLPKKIINILSIKAIAGEKNIGLYSLTKAAFWCFTRSLRRTYGNQIQVIEVLPTPFFSDLAVNTVLVDGADSQKIPHQSIVKTIIKKIYSLKKETSASVAKSIFVKEKRGEEIIFMPSKAVLICLLEAFSSSIYNKLYNS